MSENQNANAAANAAEGEAPKTETAPAWFTAYVEAQRKETESLKKELDKRFDGFRKKYIEPADEGAAKQPKSVTLEDLDAAMRLGRLEAKIPDTARERLQQIRQERGIQDAALFAEMLVESLPAKATEEPAERSVPKGKGASPAPSSASLPKTQAEFMRWSKDKQDAALEHPDFDFYKLPMR